MFVVSGVDVLTLCFCNTQAIIREQICQLLTLGQEASSLSKPLRDPSFTHLLFSSPWWMGVRFGVSLQLAVMHLSDLHCYGLASHWAHFHPLPVWRPVSNKGGEQEKRKLEEERRTQIVLQLNLKWKLMENALERESGVGEALARKKRDK